MADIGKKYTSQSAALNLLKNYEKGKIHKLLKMIHCYECSEIIFREYKAFVWPFCV